MEGEEYKCGHCGGVFKKGWSDEKSNKEAEENFGKHPDQWKEEKVIICDDCYKLMDPKKNPELVEKIKKQL